MVYVISQDGRPLMPTERYGKVRHMLRDGRARVVRREPFTIQLTYGTGAERTQPGTLGFDSASKQGGFAVVNEMKTLIAGEFSGMMYIRTLMRSADTEVDADTGMYASGNLASATGSG